MYTQASDYLYCGNAILDGVDISGNILPTSDIAGKDHPLRAEDIVYLKEMSMVMNCETYQTQDSAKTKAQSILNGILQTCKNDDWTKYPSYGYNLHIKPDLVLPPNESGSSETGFIQTYWDSANLYFQHKIDSSLNITSKGKIDGDILRHLYRYLNNKFFLSITSNNRFTWYNNWSTTCQYNWIVRSGSNYNYTTWYGNNTYSGTSRVYWQYYDNTTAGQRQYMMYQASITNNGRPSGGLPMMMVYNGVTSNTPFKVTIDSRLKNVEKVLLGVEYRVGCTPSGGSYTDTYYKKWFELTSEGDGVWSPTNGFGTESWFKSELSANGVSVGSIGQTYEGSCPYNTGTLELRNYCVLVRCNDNFTLPEEWTWQPESAS